ncbi:hypothetical protein PHYBLDRAFT_66703 [Phycomyces blakesleeanus NRRL 1555(-)]|uniref:Uncharacterized protein n=1 Tax=Phycomyces blakesleeanus (strain ATCC 8743b / DSM 1359 / FGSC 10004 / NBRC 33097 / NRRL 1555) TaxID=763407 RepID=A0A163D7J1_PHYB8|nr:hypothetical protein PHYBLDRAFT_66703 [Phycomyces blakesleeanus NRRL 1555(-)]OAD69330.1 hypothetical protein PHYBLDRAFT_66703 [Phycomyces blakesleeanus NRRL 1555(-)]|eukprot:XP_018287370.1 hypothetical protein PHYBLDRAFT_66703 [Phycomyces blakesleeanus NRRL 1555(-)]
MRGKKERGGDLSKTGLAAFEDKGKPDKIDPNLVRRIVVRDPLPCTVSSNMYIVESIMLHLQTGVTFSKEKKKTHHGAGIFSSSSKGHKKIGKIDENTDSTKYMTVLQQGLLEALEKQNMNKYEIKFLHNNAKSHAAASTKQGPKKS